MAVHRTSKRLAVGEVWHVELPYAKGLLDTMQIEQLTDKTVVLSTRKIVQRFRIADVQWIERTSKAESWMERDAARYQWLRERWTKLVSKLEYDGEIKRIVDIALMSPDPDFNFDPQSLDQQIDIHLEKERLL